MHLKLKTTQNNTNLFTQVQEFEQINGLLSMPYVLATKAIEMMKKEGNGKSPLARSPAPGNKEESADAKKSEDDKEKSEDKKEEDVQKEGEEKPSEVKQEVKEEEAMKEEEAVKEEGKEEVKAEEKPEEEQVQGGDLLTHLGLRQHDLGIETDTVIAKNVTCIVTNTCIHIDRVYI